MSRSSAELPPAPAAPVAVAARVSRATRRPRALRATLRRIGRRVEVGRGIVALTAAQVGTTAVTSALGFVYWWVAARLFTPDVVGLGAASTSAMLLLGTLSMSGLGTMLIRELPRHREQRRFLILAAGLLAAVVGGAAGMVVAAQAALFSAALRPLSQSAGTVLLFAAGVGVTGLALVVDQAVLGLLRGRLQLLRNAAFAAAKLAALAGVGLWARAGGIPPALALFAVYTSWLLGNLLSLGVVLLAARRRSAVEPASGAADGLRQPSSWSLLRALGPSTLAHHALNLAFLASSLLLPVVVAWQLSIADNAYFYTSWMLANVVGIVPFTLTVSLYAVGSADPRLFARKMRFTLAAAFLVAAPAALALLAGADLVLGLFGPAYAANGAGSLRLFALAVFPLIVKDHYLAVRRIRGRVGRTAPLMTLLAAMEVGGATLGAALGGLQGLSVAWLLVVGVEAICLAPSVYRAAFARAGAAPASPDMRADGGPAEPMPAGPVRAG